VIVFPILEGSHVVSEGLAKALVNRGYAAARLERHELKLAEAQGPEVPAVTFRTAILDSRRLLDWIASHPELDTNRVAAAGVSMGGILALTLMEVDPRVRAGFFIMVGGGLPEILHDSSERPVRVFRERLQSEQDLDTREAFVAYLRPYVGVVDPLTYAARIDPRTVLLASGRCDRVIRPQHTHALWQAPSSGGRSDAAPTTSTGCSARLQAEKRTRTKRLQRSAPHAFSFLPRREALSPNRRYR
jgi:pimeloyl-ACP methyl ester carboxylesterase